MQPWSQQPHNAPRSGRYAIIKGTAYREVQAGANTTRVRQAPTSDRVAFYNDPAIVLSEADLDAMDGTEGAPLCFEHNKSDVVGRIHHSWIDRDSGRLKIIARIPLTDRGRQIVDEIRAGRIAGLSVSYRPNYEQTGEVASKTFLETSLVREPFFDGCDLSVGVVASGEFAKQQAPLTYRAAPGSPPIGQQTIFVPMSDAAEPVLPGSGSDAADLLKQADALKEQLGARDKTMAEMQARLAAFEAREAAERKAYADAQAPRLQEYIKASEERHGPMSDADKKSYEAAFTDPRFKATGERFWKEHQSTQELAASKKKQEDELKALKEEARRNAETLASMSQKLGSARASIAQAVAPELTAAEVEASARDAAELRRPTRARLSDMMEVTAPAGEEIGWLREAGFQVGERDVNASSRAALGLERELLREVPAAPAHRQMLDAEGELMFPASARYHNPTVFGWLAQQSGVMADTDLTQHVTIDATKSGILEEKRVDGIRSRAIGE
jgi:hypothetical protein